MERLGNGDHIVIRPTPVEPRSMDRATYETLPELLVIRECRVRVEQTGFRIEILIVATTLLDAKEFTKAVPYQSARAAAGVAAQRLISSTIYRRPESELHNWIARSRGAIIMRSVWPATCYNRGDWPSGSVSSLFQVWEVSAN